MIHDLPQPDDGDWPDDVVIDDLPADPIAGELSQQDEDWPDDVVIDDLPADPVARSRELAVTRRMLAPVITAGFMLVALIVVIGGFMGRFGPEIVVPVVSALAASQTVVAYFYFRYVRRA